MKRRLRLFFIALLVATPSSTCRVALAQSDKPSEAVASSNFPDAYVDCYQGADARWQVHRLHGVVSVWAPQRPLPLWSSDGVVFRSAPLAPDVVLTFLPDFDSAAVPATEIFSRVYFFLNDVSPRREKTRSEPFARRNELLLALDPRSQGRLVWKLRAQDFEFFFQPNASSLQFVPRLTPLPNDELLIAVQNDRQERKSFAVDAATGNVRRYVAPASSR